ncbi:hypothetical protein D3C87_624590 [compost metagenome]
MSVKEQFIRKLIDELNNVNKHELFDEERAPLDVCYMVSVIDQQIDDCQEFMDTITTYRYQINDFSHDNSGGYTNGKIQILIEKPEEEKSSEMMFDAFYDYCYYIEFDCDDRMWGYCQCKPGDEGYVEEYSCSGNGCDWSAPAFRLTKSIDLGGGKWDGYESDYWNYKKKFEENELNISREVEELNKKKEREYIEQQINELQGRLNSL